MPRDWKMGMYALLGFLVGWMILSPLRGCMAEAQAPTVEARQGERVARALEGIERELHKCACR